MSLGPLMIGVAGAELTGEERRRLAHPAVGGVLLFTRNFRDRDQLAGLVAAIHAVRSPAPLVAVDHEGGRVQRFRDGFTRLPPLSALRELHDRDPGAAEEAASKLGWLMALELRAVGVDFSFAPVLDLDLGVSEVIGDRAFHSDPRVVAALAQAWCRGVRRAGMVAVGKHFPGHGGCAADSHVAHPIDERALADLEAADLVPFRRLIANGLEAVMVAHVRYPAVAPEPAGYAPQWLDGVLRRRLGFEGAIISDDLGMAAADAVGGPTERVVRCLAAGCDMAILANEREAVDALLDVDLPTPPASALRLARLRPRGEWAPVSEEDPHRRDAVSLAERLCAGRSGELEV